MPYVPGCQHDVFVSYAQADDARGWVRTLRNDLEQEIACRLNDRSTGLSVWMDYDLPRDRPFPPELWSALDGSAVLLVVLSRQYVASPWCESERQRFFESLTHRRPGEGGVVVVDLDRFDERPAELSEILAFKLWVAADKGNTTRLLGYPSPNPNNPDHYAYYPVVQDVAGALAGALDERRGGDPDPRPVGGVPRRGPERPAPTDPAASPAAGTDDSDPRGPKVILAEVTDDLDPMRAEAWRYLASEGIQILPERPYPRDPSQLSAALDADLAEAAAFVQLLSEAPGKWTDELPQGYVGLQFDRAVAAGKPILHWMSPDDDLDDVSHEGYARLLKSLDRLRISTLDEFLGEVLAEVSRPVSSNGRPRDDLWVFVNADPQDEAFAAEIAAVLAAEGVGCDLRPLASTGSARREQEQQLLECNAQILVYGTARASWVEKMLSFTRKALRQRPLGGALAVCLGPPRQKPPLRVRLPGMQTLDCAGGLEPSVIRGFVDGLRHGGTG